MREDRICPPSELLDEVAGPLLFCGEGTASHAETFRERLGSRALVVGHAPAARLWALAALGQARLDAGEDGRRGNPPTLLPAHAHHRRAETPRPG